MGSGAEWDDGVVGFGDNVVFGECDALAPVVDELTDGDEVFGESG